MTLEQYWAILQKQWKLVLICFLFVGLGTFIGSKLMTPLYQSSVLIQVAIHSSNNNQTDYDSLLASNQLVQTESALAISDPVLREVVSHYRDLSVARLTEEASSTPKVNTQLFEIDVVDPRPARAASLANSIAMTLIKQQQQAVQQRNAQSKHQIQQNLDQAQNENFLYIVQPAQPATSPIRPNVLLYTALGLLVGLLLGMALAVVYEELDTHVRMPEALTRLLKWPVLTTIWRVKSSNPEDVINPTDHDANVEPYSILRANIGFSSRDKPLRSLVVTSALPQDGKSVIAANLAIFMAKSGKNTLLIDADLRHPTQHKLFGLSPDKLGLSNALLTFSMPSAPKIPSNSQLPTKQLGDASATTEQSLEPFVYAVGIPGLWVMPSGPLPPNPSNLLELKVMQRFLAVIANSGVEIVIFDTPPLLGLPDASILASKVDSALVVVDMTRATKSKLKQMKAVLVQTGVRVLGCVANKQRHSHNDIAYSYYYSAEDQGGGEKHRRNGHTPIVPATAMPAASLSEQQRNQRS